MESAEPPWSPEEIRKSSKNLSLECDSNLLRLMEQISDDLESHAKNATTKLNKIYENLEKASISLDNSVNRLSILSQSQFVENRVFDDDDEVAARIKKRKLESSEQQNNDIKPYNPIDTINVIVQNNMKMLKNCYEKITIDLEDSDDEDGNIHSIVYRQKNPYEPNLVPHLIGSKEWQEKWHIGLCDSDESEHNSVEEDEDNVSDSLSLPSNIPRSESGSSVWSLTRQQQPITNQYHHHHKIVNVNKFGTPMSSDDGEEVSSQTIASKTSSSAEESRLSSNNSLPIEIKENRYYVHKARKNLFDSDSELEDNPKPAPRRISNNNNDDVSRPIEDHRTVSNIFNDEPPEFVPKNIKATFYNEDNNNKAPSKLFFDSEDEDKLFKENEKINQSTDSGLRKKVVNLFDDEDFDSFMNELDKKTTEIVINRKDITSEQKIIHNEPKLVQSTTNENKSLNITQANMSNKKLIKNDQKIKFEQKISEPPVNKPDNLNHDVNKKNGQNVNNLNKDFVDDTSDLFSSIEKLPSVANKFKTNIANLFDDEPPDDDFDSIFKPKLENEIKNNSSVSTLNFNFKEGETTTNETNGDSDSKISFNSRIILADDPFGNEKSNEKALNFSNLIGKDNVVDNENKELSRKISSDNLNDRYKKISNLFSDDSEDENIFNKHLPPNKISVNSTEQNKLNISDLSILSEPVNVSFESSNDIPSSTTKSDNVKKDDSFIDKLIISNLSILSEPVNDSFASSNEIPTSIKSDNDIKYNSVIDDAEIKDYFKKEGEKESFEKVQQHIIEHSADHINNTESSNISQVIEIVESEGSYSINKNLSHGNTAGQFAFKVCEENKYTENIVNPGVLEKSSNKAMVHEENISTNRNNFSTNFISIEPPDDDDIIVEKEDRKEPDDLFSSPAKFSTDTTIEVKTPKSALSYGSIGLFEDVPPDFPDVDSNHDFIDGIYGFQSSDDTDNTKTHNEDFQKDSLIKDSKSHFNNTIFNSLNENFKQPPLEDKNKQDKIIENKKKNLSIQPKKINSNLNINVSALLPGTKSPYLSTKVKETISKGETDGNILTRNLSRVENHQLDKKDITRDKKEFTSKKLEHLNKNRPKIQVKRRPQSRAAREENYKKSLLADNYLVAEISSVCDNVHGKITKQVEKTNSIENKKIEENKTIENDKLKSVLITPKLEKKESAVENLSHSVNSSSSKTEEQQTFSNDGDFNENAQFKSKKDNCSHSIRKSNKNPAKELLKIGAKDQLTNVLDDEDDDWLIKALHNQSKSNSQANEDPNKTNTSSANNTFNKIINAKLKKNESTEKGDPLLFKSDSEDDDLFSVSKRRPLITGAHKKNPETPPQSTSLFDDQENVEEIFKKVKIKFKPNVAPFQKKSLFSSDDDEDDLFGTGSTDLKKEQVPKEKKVLAMNNRLFDDEGDDDDDIFGTSKGSNAGLRGSKQIVNQAPGLKEKLSAKKINKSDFKNTQVKNYNPLADLLNDD